MRYAQAFGWTPRQVDQDVPAHLDPLLLPVYAVVLDVEHRYEQEQAKQTKG